MPTRFVMLYLINYEDLQWSLETAFLPKKENLQQLGEIGSHCGPRSIPFPFVLYVFYVFCLCVCEVEEKELVCGLRRVLGCMCLLVFVFVK